MAVLFLARIIYPFFLMSSASSFKIATTLRPLSLAIRWASSTRAAVCRSISHGGGSGMSLFWYCHVKSRIAIFFSCCLINPSMLLVPLSQCCFLWPGGNASRNFSGLWSMRICGRRPADFQNKVFQYRGRRMAAGF